MNRSKAQIAEENRLRVQRQRAENRFMKTLSANFEVEHLTTLQQEAAVENRAVDTTRSLRKERIATHPDTREGFAELNRFGEGVRCVEITQGGATIWTATEAGSIQIHSGQDGRLVHTVTTLEDDVHVEVMQATATHMWVGLSNGTVQVYDHMVFLHITEGRFHSSAVTSFCPTVDGRMFSGSADGIIVKWDTELKSFEAMSKITTTLPGVSAMAAMQYRLFAASENGQLLCLDVDSADILSSVVAHEGGITTVAVVDGSVFTGGKDLQVKVWSSQGDQLNTIAVVDVESPVVAFGADHGSHRVLIGHEDGSISLMRTGNEDTFTIERTFHEYQGQNLKSLKCMTAVDSLKIWSLASNGVNKVWYSSRNQVATAMEGTLESLRAVIHQDTVELDKWKNLAFRLQCINARRKVQLAASLAQYHADLNRRLFLWKWKQVVRQRMSQRRKVAIANRLALEEEVQFKRRTFYKFYRWYRSTQNLRLKTRYADLLMHTNRKNVTLFYFRKMQTFTRHMKLSLKRRDATRMLGQHNAMHFLRTYFRKLMKYRVQCKENNRKIAFAQTLFRSSLASLRRLYWMKWIKASQRAAMVTRRKKFGDSLMEMTTRGLRLTAYQKWIRYVRDQKSNRRKMNLAGALMKSTDRGLMQATYAKLLTYRARKISEREQDQQAIVEAEVQAMRERYAQLQHIIDEKKALDALKKQLADETEELEVRKIKHEQMNNERNELAQQITDRDFEAVKKAKSVAEQMMSLMANLKAKVINFHLDFNLMNQIREKLRQGQPVTKVFLEAHQQVKRIVVEATKKPHLQQEEWPLTEAMVTKLPSHNLTVLLTSIKAMIITFDVMDKETRDGLQSDVEIVMNAKWLLRMAEHCVTYRKKTLGHR